MQIHVHDPSGEALDQFTDQLVGCCVDSSNGEVVGHSDVIFLAVKPQVFDDVAERLQVSPDPFLMAVAVAASCAFLTPIGHKNNTLIMGPGGYGFGDYWRMGLPLELLVVITAIPMILLVWPL